MYVSILSRTVEFIPFKLMSLTKLFVKGESMNKGIVKFFNANKGFGFIVQDQGKDIFFHCSEVKGDNPVDGDKVTYEVGESRQGPCAINVQVLH